MKYHEQLKHPLWQKKRLEVLEAAEFKCVNCGSKEDQLHVHHPFYKRGAMIWDYDSKELQCLCDKCHKTAHEIDEKIKFAVSLLDQSEKTRLLGYLHALNVDPPFKTNNSNYIQGYVDGIRHDDKLIFSKLPPVSHFMDLREDFSNGEN